MTVARPRFAPLAALAMSCCSGTASAQSTCSTAADMPALGIYTASNAASAGDGVTGLCAQTSRSHWVRFVPTSTGNHTISLGGSTFNSVASLYSACSSPLPTVLACDDDSIGDDAVIVYPLTAGLTYYIRVASFGSTPGGTITLRVVAPLSPAPVNDICATSTTLALNSVTSVSNRGATGATTSGCATLDSADVWFSFNAPAAGVYLVQVCSPVYQPVLSAHASCINPVTLQCNSGAILAPCAALAEAGAALAIPVSVPGTQRLRLAGNRGAAGPATIAVYAPQPNDACDGAAPLVLDTPVAGTITPALGTDATVACATSGLDVWHRFIPIATGQYTFSIPCAQFGPVLSLHSACPATPGSQVLACNGGLPCVSGVGAATVSVTLTAGQPYLVRVASAGSSGATIGEYTLTVTTVAPANDNCASATTLSEGVPVTASSLGATGTDVTSCGSSDSRDVWFAFTPAATATYEFNTCGSPLATTLAVFSGNCANQISCAEPTGGFCGQNLQGAGLSVALTAGVGYRVRVAGINADTGPFTLAVARAPAVGDACTSPIALTQGVEVAATLAGAGPSGFSACAPDGDDVWFSFTPAATRFYRFSTCGSASPLALSLATGCSPTQGLACSTSQPDACGSGRPGAALTALLQAGSSYRLRVFRTPSSVGGAFRLRVDPSAPSNDSCATPLAASIGGTILGSTTDATSEGLLPCSITEGPDVWFSITPSQSGYYRIDTCADAGIDTSLGLFDACSGTPTSCNDDAAGCPTGRSRLVARLGAGQTYLVRVAGKGGAQGPFLLTVVPTPPPNDTCSSATSIGEGGILFDTANATTDSAFVDGVCASALGFNLLSADVWFRYTAAASGSVTVSTCGATYDTALTVSAAGSGCPSGVYNVLACNDNAVCPADPMAVTSQARTSFAATAGQVYLIRVGSRFGTTGSGVLSVSRVGACACDYDQNTALNIDDIFTFLGGWFARTPRADFDGTGTFTIDDIFLFLDCFFRRPAGC